MRGNETGGRRGRLRLVGVPAMAFALLALGQVDVEPVRYPAVTGEVQLFAASSGAIRRSEPIELSTTAIGLTWDGGSGDAAVRVSDDGVDWGPWVPVHADEHAPDEHTGEPTEVTGSDAVYTGGARWLQVQWEGGTTPELQYVDTTGETLGVGARVGAHLERLAWSTDDRAFAAPDQPEIQPRSAWGADRCLTEDARYSTRTRVDVVMVHHSLHAADANGYGPDEVDDLLYAICNFHVRSRGWKDIGYNILIDAYGRVWEGRGGGVDQPVRGAHAAGFNSSTVGVAFLGDHGSAPPTEAAQDAFVDYASWRMDVAHIDPASVPIVVSRDSPTYPDGVAVPLRAVSGHRDVGSTSCPGAVGYSLITSWIERIAQRVERDGARIFGGWPEHDPVPGNRIEGYAPTRFEFEVTTPSAWTIDVTGPSGERIVSTGGEGASGVLDWQPGEAIEWGWYRVEVQARPLDGSEPPRSAGFPFVVGDFSPPFFDDESSPLESSIDRLFELGITTGCADLRFCPTDRVERWQMALFLTRAWQAAGNVLEGAADSRFVDIEAYPEATRQAIADLATLGVTSGVSPTEFAPARDVERWQMALFLARFLQAAGAEIPQVEVPAFSDLADYGPDVSSAVDLLARAGVTFGTSATTFGPADPVTREQMAAFIDRSVTTLTGTEEPTP